MEIEVEGERRAPDAAEEGDSQIPLTSPEGAAAVMRDVLKELDREWVCVVNMDNHLKPVNFNIVSIGSINQSLAPIQNILKSGILSNCSNIMLMHNHPPAITSRAGRTYSSQSAWSRRQNSWI